MLRPPAPDQLTAFPEGRSGDGKHIGADETKRRCVHRVWSFDAASVGRGFGDGKRLLLPGSGCCAESSRRRWHAPRQARAVRLVRFDRSGSDMRPPLGPTVCYRCTRLVVRIAQRMRPASSTQERQQGRTHRCRIAARRTLPRESRDLKGQSMARRRERRRPARRPSRGAGRRRPARRPSRGAERRRRVRLLVLRSAISH